MKTAIIHHPIYGKHDTGPGHPETPERYEVVMDALKKDKKLWNSLDRDHAGKSFEGIGAGRAHRRSILRRSKVRSSTDMTGSMPIRRSRCSRSTRRCLPPAERCARCRCGDAGQGGQCFCRGASAGPSRHGGETRWAFAFSIMSRSPRAMRRTNTKRSNVSRLSIGMCITETERRAFFTTIRRFSFSRCTSIRGIREPARAAKRDSAADSGRR